MKKVLAVAAFAAFGLMSCKKDYTCECVTTAAGVQTGTTTVTINDTKGKATETCDEGDDSASVFGFTTTTACEIN
tara:strand:- start:4563 stop:4787 length:225 start_codon:yes stop_codon:yes gene_type:complete